MNTVVVHKNSSLQGETLVFPSALAAQLSVADGSTRIVTFGMGLVEASIKVKDGFSTFPYTIEVSTDTSSNLGIVQDEQLQLYAKDVNTLVFGPLLGILGYCKNEQHTAQYSYLANKASNNDGLVVLFDPSGVESTLKRINGWYYSPIKGWVSGTFPYPEVIYRRIALNNDQKKKLYEMNVKAIFNEMFWLNKWDVHQVLSQYPKITDHLPTTHSVTTPTEVVKYLDEYKDIFLKPTLGYLGRGVVKLDKVNGCYVAHARSKGVEQRNQYHTQAELLEYLGTIHLKSGYILQRTIPLARYDGELFDFRVMIQKGQDGKWFCSGALARVAQEGHIMTHISHGAVPVDVETAFAISLGLSKDAAAVMKREMIDWCKELSQALETEYGVMGDLGFDIGVDNKGKLWYIECNANPDHTIFEKYDAMMYSGISSMPRLYSKYLSEQG